MVEHLLKHADHPARILSPGQTGNTQPERPLQKHVQPLQAPIQRYAQRVDATALGGRDDGENPRR